MRRRADGGRRASVLPTERETGVQTIYVFDGHELDTARFELRRGELCLPLQPKVLRGTLAKSCWRA
jgi:hypothetical protein